MGISRSLSLLAALFSSEFEVWKSGSVLEGQCFAVGLFQFSFPVPRFSLLMSFKSSLLSQVRFNRYPRRIRRVETALRFSLFSFFSFGKADAGTDTVVISSSESNLQLRLGVNQWA